MQYRSLGLYAPRSPFGIEIELQRWIDRAAPVKPTQHVINVLNRMIKEIKEIGVWDKLDCLYWFACNDLRLGMLNLVQPKYDCVPNYNTNMETLTALFREGIGIKGDGTLAALRAQVLLGRPNYDPILFTNVNTKYQKNDSHIAVFAADDINPQETTVYLTGAIRLGTTYGIRAEYINKAFFWPNNPSSTGVSFAVDKSSGFYAWSRASADYVTAYKSGYIVENIESAPGDNLPDINPLILAANDVVLGRGFTTNTVSFVSYGSSLSASELSDYRDAVDRALISLGTIESDAPDDTTPTVYLPGTYENSDTETIESMYPVPFYIFQQAPAPRNNTTYTKANYPYFPIRDAGTQQSLTFPTTGTNYRNWHHLWGMRKIQPITAFNDRPCLIFPTITHPVTGLKCWMRYTSYEYAIAAVEVVARWTLGLPKYSSNPYSSQDMGWGDACLYWGVDPDSVVTWNYANTNAQTMFSDIYKGKSGKWSVAYDKIILPQARLIDGVNPTGLVLDAEMQDYRTPEMLLDQLTRLSDIVTGVGKKLLVYTNPLINPGAINTGFSDSNLWDIHTLPNTLLTVVAWRFNSKTNVPDTLDRQLALITAYGDLVPRNLIMQVAIGRGSNELLYSDMDYIRSLIQGDGSDPETMFGGVLFWRDYGSPGGPKERYYNQCIARCLGLEEYYV